MAAGTSRYRNVGTIVPPVSVTLACIVYPGGAAAERDVIPFPASVVMCPFDYELMNTSFLFASFLAETGEIPSQQTNGVPS
jgi:hypothetical protein